MINEPNLMNTAINDMYSSQKVQFSHPTTSGSAALRNYNTQMAQYGTSSTAHSATGAAQAAFMG